MSNFVKSKLLIYLRTSCPIEDIWMRHRLKLTLLLISVTNSEWSTWSMWNEWTHWSYCSLTCGEGQRYRRRTCKTKSSGHKADVRWCRGDHRETLPCYERACRGLHPVRRFRGRGRRWNHRGTFRLLRWLTQRICFGLAQHFDGLNASYLYKPFKGLYRISRYRVRLRKPENMFAGVHEASLVDGRLRQWLVRYLMRHVRVRSY